ncbi:MAG: GTP 3',8-cyclase MoaA [Armatimonadetes bacterium]|nr:GTP 3',8-cyclase MoaA [Armatimonadota bacterium]
MIKPAMFAPIQDVLARPLRTLRISVTDRCNLRCSYCMPEEHYTWLPRKDLLSFEEMATLVDAFVVAGVRRVRLTGGEPQLRRDLPRLVRLLGERTQLEDLALTTNGVLLGAQAGPLKEAGLRRVTVSLDTLRRDRFQRLARRDDLDRVLAGVRAAAAVGLRPLKLDCVVMLGDNDDELADMVEFARSVGAEVRFIEYMDVGGATRWSMDRVVSRSEILARLRERYGSVRELERSDSAPAERCLLPDGTRFGIVASTTRTFCRTCDRARLTADGRLFLCLYALHGLDLRGPLREGASGEELVQRIVEVWSRRQDRGAEERLALRERGVFVPLEGLREDPHLEMHTRGG